MEGISSITTQIKIESNALLHEVYLPLLSIGTTISIQNNNALNNISIPNSAFRKRIRAHCHLAQFGLLSIEFDTLDTVYGQLNIQKLTLDSLYMPQLNRLSGGLVLNYNDLASMDIEL